jgi:hyaluronan synthase
MKDQIKTWVEKLDKALEKIEKRDEVFTVPRPDRRTLTYVPDPENIRTNVDRRGSGVLGSTDDPEYINRLRLLSLRYSADFDVYIHPTGKKASKKRKLKKQNGMPARAADISATGILVACEEEVSKHLQVGSDHHLQFTIPPGTMPEGFENSVRTDARVVRKFTKIDRGQEKHMVAFQFEKPLTEYFKRKQWGYSIYVASTTLFFAALIVILMRVESVLYFQYHMTLYLYSIIAAAYLLSRYLFGGLYRETPINPGFTPSVSIIIPCFNEEKWIRRTIISCMNQDYPVDKLEVIVVDDHSTDRSAEEIENVIAMIHREVERFETKKRLFFYRMPVNGGKRKALMEGVRRARHELVVFVDSDSFLEPTAIKHIVQPFQDPKVGGVAGRTEVENKFTNFYTKMQTVRYYIAFRIMKAAESYFDCVTCLSGPLSCYRKDLVIRYSDAWLNQTFLGHPATFGDDRSMTNLVLRNHRTVYQDSAICSTIVPSDRKVFLKQQMRWKRSWLRETLSAGSFIWRKEPFMALFFYIGFIVPLLAPIVVLYNLVYVPLAEGVFPGIFLFGLFIMAALMSLAHLFFKRSKLWYYGFIFCIFYEFVLLWQMPVAWVTFWKSTWGTRETPKDVEEKLKKANKQKRRKPKDGGGHA